MSILASVRRPVWLRLLLSVWALWFATALTAVGPLGSCLGHSRHGSAATHTAKSHSASSHAGHGPQSAITAVGSHNAPRIDRASEPHALCSCLGFCCCVPAATLPNDAAGPLAIATRRVSVIRAPSAIVMVGRAPHAHPFANGPPLTELA